MSRRSPYLLAALAALATGCPRQVAPVPATDSAPRGDRADSAPEPAVERPRIELPRGGDGAPGAASPPAEPPEPLGFEPCDTFLAQHHRCVTRHLPQGLRPLALQGLASTRAAWARALRANEVARLRLSCEAWAETTRQSMKRYGCRY